MKLDQDRETIRTQLFFKIVSFTQGICFISADTKRGRKCDMEQYCSSNPQFTNTIGGTHCYTACPEIHYVDLGRDICIS